MMDLSPAGSALVAGGFGLGSVLGQQVKQETEDERRRRMLQIQAQRAGLSPAGRAVAYGGMNANLSF